MKQPPKCRHRLSIGGVVMRCPNDATYRCTNSAITYCVDHASQYQAERGQHSVVLITEQQPPDKCPGCGGALMQDDDGAWRHVDRRWDTSEEMLCLERQRDALAARLSVAERERDQALALLGAYKMDKDALSARVRKLEAVCNEPQALWANWLRGAVALPAGIGDVRQEQGRVKELEDKMARLIAAGDAFAETAEPTAWDNWVKAKEAKS